MAAAVSMRIIVYSWRSGAGDGQLPASSSPSASCNTPDGPARQSPAHSATCWCTAVSIE